ncbi:MAG TPA: c-type cytochrome [Gammaproteobacteria bacterium]|nr:c-type cytochrome [Gammaproteobacteria bacterium]
MNRATIDRWACGLLLLALATTGVAHAEKNQGVEFDFENADKWNGEEINYVCAGCHGEFGEGTRDGEYPRLAGLPASYIAEQLILFRERERRNIPMYEYVDDRQMPDTDIRDIAAFLSNIELPKKLPELKEGEKFDPLARLKMSQRIVNIPRTEEGDPDKGRKMYNFDCRSCHGDEGAGRPDKGIPQLAGQYTEYLKRSTEMFIEGGRIHDEDDPDWSLLGAFTPEERQDIWAYLSIVDDPE